MFTYVYSIFLVIWDILCCKLFMEAFVCNNKKNKKSIDLLLLICLVIIDYLIIIFLSNNFLIKEICIIIISVLMMMFYFRFSIKKTGVLFLLFQAIALVIEYVTIIILSRAFPEISEYSLEIPAISMLITSIGKILLFCFVLIIKKNFGTKNIAVFTNQEWMRFSIFPFFTVASIIAIITNWNLFNNINQENVLLCIAIGLLALNIIIFYLINDVLKREMQIREDKIFRERVKNETEMYRSISENYEKQRKRAHEYRNQVTCIVELAKNSKYDELNKYLKIVDDDIMASSDFIDTNNVIVNAILNSKYRECKNKGITFILHINDLANIKIADEDIVIILSNLLNNAIEACEESIDKIIKFKFIKEKSNIIISVINTMQKYPKYHEGRYKTNKVSKEDHGIGIENVINSLKKYNGSYLIEPIKNSFHFTILIPNS